MCQRPHPVAEISVNDLVIECGFRGSHSVVGTVIDQIRNRLDDDFIIAADQRIEVHPHISSDGSDDLFISEVAADGINTGRIAAGGDDAGQALRGINVAVVSHYRRDAPSGVIGQLADLAEMDDARCGRFVDQVDHIAHYGVAVHIDHGYADAIHAGVPIACRCSAAHVAATAVDVFISGCIGRHSDGQHQSNGENKRKDSLHRCPPFRFFQIKTAQSLPTAPLLRMRGQSPPPISPILFPFSYMLLS